jgi:superfamily II DNA or RNA helicase
MVKSVDVINIIIINPIKEREELIKNCQIIPDETEYGQPKSVMCCEVVKCKVNNDCVITFEDEVKKRDNRNVYLPFAYSFINLKTHFKAFPNDDLKLEKWEEKLNFKVSLFERQKTVLPEIIEILRKTHSVIMALNCGWGKTYMFIYLCYLLKLPVLITVFRENLIRQIVKSIKTCIPSAMVQVLDSKVRMKNAHFYIISVQSLCSRPREDYDRIGIFGVDELHTTLSPEYSKILLHVRPRYVIGMSATPFPKNSKMGEIARLHFGNNVVYRPLYQPHNVYIVKTDFKPKTKSTKAGRLDWHHVIEQQSEDEERNMLIVDIAKFFADRDILILGKRVGHAKILDKMLTEEGEDSDTFIESKLDYRYDCRVLNATYSKGGVGFDAPNLDMLIVAGDSTNDTGTFIQYLGRVFRKDGVPIVIDFKDKNNVLNKHLVSRMVVYCGAGGEIRDFDKCFPEFEKWRCGDFYRGNEMLKKRMKKLNEDYCYNV